MAAERITEDLIQRLRKVGNPNALRKFFAMADELLQYTNLSTHDPRLVFHLRKDSSLGIILNFFTALRFDRRNNGVFELLFLERDAQQLRLSHPAISFSALAESNGVLIGKISSENRHLLEDTRVLAAWQSALDDSLQRATHSPKRKHHSEELYELAADETLRHEVLWQLEKSFSAENEEVTQAEEPAAAYVIQRPSFKKNQIYQGPPGTGKTFQAKADARPFEHRLLTFHPSYDYHEFIEGLRPVAKNGQVSYEVHDGLFLKFCRQALQLAGYASFADYLAADPLIRRAKLQAAPPLVVIIDELSRGNVSAIFGELLTVLETAKRLGEEEETTVVLPYSHREMGVPTNLYLIATMNTADRSVASLDYALRRRFVFRDFAPDYELLPEKIGEVALRQFLQTLNERIQYYIGEAFAVGHAYFLEVTTYEDLCDVMATQLIPLLQAYFLNDFQKIRSVLGDDRPQKKTAFLLEKPSDFRPQSAELRLEEEQALRYRINPDLLSRNISPDAFRI